jgi:hypothetical protein
MSSASRSKGSSANGHHSSHHSSRSGSRSHHLHGSHHSHASRHSTTSTTNGCSRLPGAFPELNTAASRSHHHESSRNSSGNHSSVPRPHASNQAPKPITSVSYTSGNAPSGYIPSGRSSSGYASSGYGPSGYASSSGGRTRQPPNYAPHRPSPLKREVVIPHPVMARLNSDGTMEDLRPVQIVPASLAPPGSKPFKPIPNYTKPVPVGGIPIKVGNPNCPFCFVEGCCEYHQLNPAS